MMRRISTYIPPPWLLRAIEELVLFPGKGLVRIIDRPVRAYVDADLLERLRAEQRRRKRPIGELLEDALRLLLDPPLGAATGLPVLPPANPLVDLSDRKALDRAARSRV